MSQNLYNYIGNNPINYVDPTGHNGNDVNSYSDYLYTYDQVVTTKSAGNNTTKKYSNAEKYLIINFPVHVLPVNQNKKDTYAIVDYINKNMIRD